MKSISEARYEAWVSAFKEAKSLNDQGTPIQEAIKKAGISHGTYYDVKNEFERRNGVRPQGSDTKVITYTTPEDAPKRRGPKVKNQTEKWNPSQVAEFLKSLGVL